MEELSQIGFYAAHKKYRDIEIFNELRRYQDTGLTPEECAKLARVRDAGRLVVQWIDVKDKLPNREMASVLIYTKEGGIAEGYYSQASATWTQFRWSIGNAAVTHWMPLPKAPFAPDAREAAAAALKEREGQG